MKTHRPGTFAGTLLLSAFLAGCACTDIGCDGGLAVRFDRAPAGAFRVEARPEGPMPPQVFECPEGGRCPAAFFPGVVTSRVTVRVTTAAGTTTQEFRPQYEKVYPNGRLCGAACRQATVTVRLPG